jgi:hypothetical protein
LAHRVYYRFPFSVAEGNAKGAIDLIESGARLRDVAALMGVPMALGT